MLFNNISLGQFSSYNEKRIYNIFNIVLVLNMVVMFCISLFYLSIGAYVSLYVSIGAIVLYLILLILHTKGFYIFSRFSYFLITILTEVYGSLYHGENSGFDFYFLVTALTPVLFFHKRIHYLSLFVLSLTGYVLVKYLYTELIPIMPFAEKQILPYYANLVLSASLIFVGYGISRSEHLKYERDLKLQKDKIHDQKERLSALKEELEAHLENKEKVVELQGKNIKKYAFLNAHKARSPLARILGLINLTHFEDLSKEETRNFYLNKLQSNAKELDEVLTEITDILTEDIKK